MKYFKLIFIFFYVFLKIKLNIAKIIIGRCIFIIDNSKIIDLHELEG